MNLRQNEVLGLGIPAVRKSYRELRIIALHCRTSNAPGSSPISCRSNNSSLSSRSSGACSSAALQNSSTRKFDLAFRTGTLKDTSVVTHQLWRGQLRCFASREYLRDRGTPLTPRDLRRHECFLFTPLAPRGRWTFRSRGRAMEVPVRGRLVVNSIPLAIEAAARGLGIARLPGAVVIEGLAANQLVEVLDAYAPPARRLYAVHASGGRVSPAARAFLEIAKRHLERLDGQAAATRD